MWICCFAEEQKILVSQSSRSCFFILKFWPFKVACASSTHTEQGNRAPNESLLLLLNPELHYFKAKWAVERFLHLHMLQEEF